MLTVPRCRMFTGSLMEEAKALEEDINAVRDKVEDPQICEKVKLFVYAAPEIQAIYKADAGVHLSCLVVFHSTSPANPRTSC